jgi:uncharacterized membrane protein (DUF4010 family)
MPIDTILLEKVLLSIGIGALVGIEREMRAKTVIFAGARTFMLVCLLGFVSAYMTDLFGSIWPLLVSFISVGALTVSSYLVEYHKLSFIGATTKIAFILTFAIGATINYQEYPYYFPISLAILLTIILSFKETLHGFARHLTRKEIGDALIFGVIAFIILPILPNYPIDPFGALNPYLIWLSLVLVLGISFASYVTMKALGPKMGLALTGFFGGLVSSTALTVTLVEKVKKNPKILYSTIFSIILASATMFLRVIAVSYIINYNVGVMLATPLLVLGMIGYGYGLLVLRKIKDRKIKVGMESPLALKPALKFAIFFFLILLIFQLMKMYFGTTGVYIVALVAGLVQLDAITVSLSSLALDTLSPSVATVGIILACLSNTFSKWLLAHWIGTREISIETGKIFALLIAVGMIILFLY